MAAPILRPLTLGEIFDVSVQLYRSLFRPLLIITIACRALPLVVGMYLQASGIGIGHLGILFGSSALGWTLNAVAVAATTTVVSAAYLGASATAGDGLRSALAILGRLLLVFVIFFIAIMAGFIALIIPGLILLAGLAMAVPVLVVERPRHAVRALDRSWALTRGYRFKVLMVVLLPYLLLVVPTVIVAAIGGGMSGVAAMAKPGPHLGLALLTAVLTVFVYPLIYVVRTVLYYDLRVRKEGFDLELLAGTAQPS